MRLLSTVCFLLLAVFTACSCKITKDPSTSPLALNQYRAEMQLDGETFIGIAGTTNKAQDLRVRHIAAGDFKISGQDDCGFTTGSGFSGFGWMSMNMGILPDNDICVYQVHIRINDLDEPAGGFLLVRQFRDPNVVRLRIQVNNKERLGWGAVALRREKSRANIPVDSGIDESRIIRAYPSSRTGQITISSENCSYHLEELYDLEEKPWEINIKALYQKIGLISKPCLFEFLFNNDHALKEGASVLVTVYDEPNKFMPAPRVYTDGGDTCFAFEDPYIIGVIVNDERSKINKQELCVSTVTKYIVEGYTSVYRSFYGVFDNGRWTEMK